MCSSPSLRNSLPDRTHFFLTCLLTSTLPSFSLSLLHPSFYWRFIVHFTQQRMSVLAAEHRLMWYVRVLEECGVVNPNAGILGEFPESEGGVQIQLPTLLLLAPPKILLKHKQRNKFTIINKTKYSSFMFSCLQDGYTPRCTRQLHFLFRFDESSC